MATSMPALADDLAAETEVLGRALAPLDPAAWLTPTPSPGWSIRDQIAHLAYFDEAALTALLDPDRFRAQARALIARGGDFADKLADELRSMPVEEVYPWFRSARHSLIAQARGGDPSLRVPWYGVEMSLASSVTARLMETWAHGADVADALGIVVEPTNRLRHVAHLGYRALPFSFGVRGLEVPTAPVRVELAAPDGGTWVWGPEEAIDRVCGEALDFCLVVTQRRHRDDTELEITGGVAGQWMSIAQAFAGPAGTGRRPGWLTTSAAKHQVTPA